MRRFNFSLSKQENKNSNKRKQQQTDKNKKLPQIKKQFYTQFTIFSNKKRNTQNRINLTTAAALLGKGQVF